MAMPTSKEVEDLAVAFNAAIIQQYGKEVSVTAVVAAAGSVISSYIEAVPDYDHREALIESAVKGIKLYSHRRN